MLIMRGIHFALVSAIGFMLIVGFTTPATLVLNPLLFFSIVTLGWFNRSALTRAVGIGLGAIFSVAGNFLLWVTYEDNGFGTSPYYLIDPARGTISIAIVAGVIWLLPGAFSFRSAVAKTLQQSESRVTSEVSRELDTKI